MIARYRIQNESWFMEAERSQSGLYLLKSLRANNPDFKRRRIRDIIQAWPSKIKIGRVYSFGRPYEEMP